MSSPHLGGGSAENSDSMVIQNSLELKERNYMGILSDCSSSSVESSAISTSCLNMKATELKLGLPGSQSPDRDSSDFSLVSSSELNERLLFPLHPSRGDVASSLQKNVVLGNKRGFSDAMGLFSEGKLPANSIAPHPSTHSGIKSCPFKESPVAPTQKTKELAPANDTAGELNTKHTNAPATKAQVVGWPPVRSFRKNSLAVTSKKACEADDKAGGPPGAIFVKVSMDGAPYLRKVDLKSYKAYQELSFALESMFGCFTIGQCASHGAIGSDMLSERKLKDLLHGSEYVLTYEDKDGDWMLVGDVPWEMFTQTCKRMRIMKGSDAIGLAPRAVEKCKNRN